MSITGNRMKTVRLDRLVLLLFFCEQFAHVDSQAQTAVRLGLFFSYVLLSIYRIVHNKIPINTNTRFAVIWVFLFWSYAIISSIWSDSISLALNKTILVGGLYAGVLLLFIVYDIKNEDDFKCYINIYLISMLVLLTMLVITTPISVWGTERLGESVGLNSNTLGMTMSVAAFAAVFAARYWKQKWICYVLAVLFGAVSLYSGSRKAFLMLLMLLSVYLILRTKGFKALLVVACVCMGCAILYQVIMINDGLYNVLGKRLEILFTGADSGSTNIRAFMREYAMGMFLEKPIAGHGMNAFYIRMLDINYQLKAYSHCNYTELLACYGIIGFTIYYILIGRIAFYGALLYKKNKAMSAFLAALICAFLIRDYGSVSYYSLDVYYMYALALGALTAFDSFKISRNKLIQRKS